MKSLLPFFFLLLAGRLLAQPVVRLKAYSQVFTPGMIRQRDIPDENGEGLPRQALGTTQYYIYAILSTARPVSFKRLWIKGQWYQISGSRMQHSPVWTTGEDQTLLVPATRQRVIRLERGDSLRKAPRLFPALRREMQQASLIVIYHWKGKLYYRSIRTITELEKKMAV